ncbi:MAG: hypothetical protein K2Q09_06465, partial [Phycisphaerales bacterium]|nr:hypothetical protein [Phycisphaerales bacterium]
TKQDLFSAEAQMAAGKKLYSPTDIDGSKLVDANDLVEYATKLQNGTAPDIVKDGVNDVYDLDKILEEFFAGTQLVDDKPADIPVPANLAAVVLHPEDSEPWCHHIMLSAVSMAVSPPGGSISSVCTPEAVILLLIQALEAQGYSVAQIVIILAGTGFSAALIAQVYGTTVEAIEAILAQTVHWAYCRALYGSYKAACALAGACKGPANAANCDSYRANFLANATCAILRSKHMTECIPQSLRPMWDPEGGHGKQIVERWNAAAKCALLFAQAGCGALPPLTPPNIPGLGPMTITPGEVSACTTGAVRYAVAAGTCGSYGAERYTDIPDAPIDWGFVYQQLGITP